ncbi:MAG: proteasome accessory factor PafA2 family protein [Candidatus Liptonbacteria bacterium]|nr:proteasome accessory factor PafA2 family protein [Candidatus Liptonbacteria bacterium]
MKKDAYMHRIIGFEHEFDFLFYDGLGNPIEDVDATIRPRTAYLKKFMDILCGLTFHRMEHNTTDASNRAIFENGGMTHIELSTTIEISSPECRNAAEAVVYDKAMDLLLNTALQRWNEQAEKNDLPGLKIFKKNTGIVSGGLGDAEDKPLAEACRYPISRAFHESYRITGRLFNEITRPLEGKSEGPAYLASSDRANFPREPQGKFWSLFLVARYLLSGCGGIVCNPDLDSREPFIFAVSPRFFNTELVLGSVATNRESRSIINSRTDSQIEDEKCGLYNRLHVVCGDANMMEKSVWLTLGASSLVLEVLENNCFDPELASDFYVLGEKGSFGHFLREIAVDQTGETKIKLVDGKVQAVMEILWRYYELCEKYAVDNMRKEHFPVLLEWKRVMGLLEHDQAGLIGVLGWPTLKWLIEEQRGSNPRASLSEERIHAVNFGFHDIDMEESLYYGLLDSFERITTDGQIRKAAVTPPETRAKLRAMLCRKLAESRQNYNASSWREIKIKKLDDSQNPPKSIEHIISLENPFATNLSQLDEKSRSVIKMLGL